MPEFERLVLDRLYYFYKLVVEWSVHEDESYLATLNPAERADLELALAAKEYLNQRVEACAPSNLIA